MLPLLKIDTFPLIDEILNRIPEHIWTSDSTTFFDPSITGGQVVSSIEKKLRAYGHSNENISKRVYGIEKNKMFVNYAVNKFNLVGTYTSKEFDYEDTQYDVIVSNPAHNHQGKSKGNKLYPKYVYYCSKMLKPDGYLSMVVPPSWTLGGNNMPGSKIGILRDIFKPNNLIVADLSSKYKSLFDKKDVSWFILQNTKEYTTTELITNHGTTNFDIRSIDFFSPEATEVSLNTWKKLFSKKPFNVIGFDMQRDPEKSLEETKTHNVKHWLLGTGEHIQYAYLPYEKPNNKNTEVNKVKKVIWPIRRFSKIPMVHVDREGIPVLQQGTYINVEGENLDSVESVFKTRVYKFLTYSYTTTDFLKSNINESMPSVPFDRIWTDDDMFNYFDLNEEERKYILTKTVDIASF